MTFLSSLSACGQAELLETEITLTKMVTIFLMGDFFWSYFGTYIYLLLGAYYKYGTYKCYSPIFLDCTVRIFEKFLRKSEQYV